ncbi:MAG: hypothetical protein JNN00_07415 [Chitinophagaceae bacterium]|nr:hypothetical protein [Chitinophagaceae bacterium]
MNYPVSSSAPRKSYTIYILVGIAVLLIGAILIGGYRLVLSTEPSSKDVSTATTGTTPAEEIKKAPILSDIEEYNSKIAHIVNGDTTGKWPVKTDYPLPGAIFPFKRIVAYYGNLYSKQMGILGELPPDQMLAKLQQEVAAWQKADTALEVVPALHYIAVTAQGSPGKNNMYRLRMPFHQIDSVLNMAARINALVFIDIQVGHSTLQQELPELEKYLKMPNVHLGIDPEFSMKGGQAPGKVVGTFDAADINYATGYLAKLVTENNLTPKVFIVHRFTQNGVTNYKQIKLRPEVQVVMDMDGWGPPELKKGTYRHFIHKEPVEYTGFKLFYKNDTKNNGRLLTLDEIMALKPRPVYIQYQ